MYFVVTPAWLPRRAIQSSMQDLLPTLPPCIPRAFLGGLNPWTASDEKLQGKNKLENSARNKKLNSLVFCRNA